MLGLAAAGERGEPDFGDLGVGDPPLLVLVVDRVRVPDRHPGLLVDAGDRLDHGRGEPGGDREPGPGAAAGGDDVVAVVGRVRPHQHASPVAPARRAVASASASSFAAPRAEFVDPLRSRVAAITGAERCGARPRAAR